MVDKLNDPMLEAVLKHATDNNLIESNSGQTAKTQEEIDEEERAAAATAAAAGDDPTPAAQVIDDLAILKEKTGGLFEKWEDIKKVEFADDNAKLLFEALQAGKLEEVRDYLNRSTEDYSKWETSKLLAEKIKRDNPSFSDNDIAEELADVYGIGADQLSEDDKVLLTEAQLKAYEKELSKKARTASSDAAKILKDLEASKKEIVLPTIKAPEPVVVKDPNQPTLEDIQAAQAAWDAEVDAEVPKNKDIKFEFEIGDGDDRESLSFEYKLSDDEVKALSSRLKSYVGEEADYSLSTKELIQKIVFKDNGQKILKAAVSEAVAKAKEKFVERELKRVDFSGSGNRGGSSAAISAAQIAMGQ